jgi:cation diffusion facilitator family transporter
VQAKRKAKAATASFLTALGLSLLKGGAFLVSGSLAILASALDSVFDFMVSLVNFLAIKEANKPPDADHSYGHGKIEAVASLFQSLIIFGSGFFLIYKSLTSLQNPQVITNSGLLIVIMIISAAITLLLTRFLKREAKATDSAALSGDNVHYLSDLWANLGIIISLIIINLTGIYFLDGLVGLVVSLVIIYSAFGLLKDSLKILTDHELPNEFRTEIIKIIQKYYPQCKSFHNLRTRKSGSEKFVDFHLVFDNHISLKDAHEVAQGIIDDIENSFSETKVLAHFDTENSR